MSKKVITYALPVIVIAIVAVLSFRQKNASMAYQKDSGFIFGTSYNVTYESDSNYHASVMKVLNDIDLSLSPFNEQSVITAVNQNKPVVLNSYFTEVFNLAKKISADTDGAFDITVAPLVNAWGFGFKNGTMPTPQQVDSLKSLIGFNKVRLADGKIIKDNPDIMLDCSAIAKGYAVDKVAEMLASKGVKNFMVEIGGEIFTKGINSKGQPWHIGVTKPSDDSLSVNQELQTKLEVSDIAMATSGNYRNFYYKNGKKYAHTIDPKTGYPIQHNILSATVLAPTCSEADAYATSFMVMGFEKAKKVLNRHPELMVYLIYNDAKGNYSVWYSPALKDKIEK